MFEYGVFRSTDNGATWQNVYVGEPDDGSLGSFLAIRYEVAAAKLPNGKTRLYVYEGANPVDTDGDGDLDKASFILRTDDARRRPRRSRSCQAPRTASRQDCSAWLADIPQRLLTLNDGLWTLQFQDLTPNPNNPLGDVIGGTQDNGTLAYSGSRTWLNFVSGDGGQAGIDAGHGNTRIACRREVACGRPLVLL